MIIDHILLRNVYYSVLRPFQDYLSSYETGQSVDGRKQETPSKNLYRANIINISTSLSTDMCRSAVILFYCDPYSVFIYTFYHEAAFGMTRKVNGTVSDRPFTTT